MDSGEYKKLEENLKRVNREIRDLKAENEKLKHNQQQNVPQESVAVFSLKLPSDKANTEAIRKTVGEVQGVKNVEVDLKSKTVTVKGTIDPQRVHNQLKIICEAKLVSFQSDKMKKDASTSKSSNTKR